MLARIVVLLIAIGCLLSCRQNPDAGGGPGARAAQTYPYTLDVDADLGLGFELRDAAFAKTLDTTAGIEVLASGFAWSEGPVWVDTMDMLLFSDVPGNVVYSHTRYSAATPRKPIDPSRPGVQGVDTFLYPSGYLADPTAAGEPGANGLLLDPDDRLLLAQHGERRLARWAGDFVEGPRGRYAHADAAYEPLATHYRGRRLNSPNDLVRLSGGDVLFTDPPYGVDKTFGADARELDFSGVYRLPAAALRGDAAAPAEPELLLRTMTRPNGIAVTPDESAVIVSNSDPQRAQWRICPLGQPRADTSEVELDCTVLADVTALVGEANPGLPDGMAMLPGGVLLATGPGGVLALSPDGEHLGTIRTGRATANVTLGGGDGRDVYITADDLLLRARLRGR